MRVDTVQVVLGLSQVLGRLRLDVGYNDVRQVFVEAEHRGRLRIVDLAFRGRISLDRRRGIPATLFILLPLHLQFELEFLHCVPLFVSLVHFAATWHAHLVAPAPLFERRVASPGPPFP